MMRKNRRHAVQLVFALATNANLAGFVNGSIYQGRLKSLCFPGLNCYSCPGALGACPVGSFQAALTTGGQKNVPFYVLGFLLLFAVVLGRFICGFLCPFGFVQDLLHKIKTPKWELPHKIDAPLRYLKYVILAVFVVGFPLFLTNAFGVGTPYFCKWICPSGTLFAGLPLLATNPSFHSLLGSVFGLKLSILLVVLVLSLFIYRPFCKYICPLGAFYGLFNRISMYRLHVDDRCIHCKKCTKTCKMGVDAENNCNSAECIRCGDCKAVCPTGAISSGFCAKGLKDISSGNNTKKAAIK